VRKFLEVNRWNETFETEVVGLDILRTETHSDLDPDLLAWSILRR